MLQFSKIEPIDIMELCFNDLRACFSFLVMYNTGTILIDDALCGEGNKTCMGQDTHARCSKAISIHFEPIEWVTTAVLYSCEAACVGTVVLCVFAVAMASQEPRLPCPWEWSVIDSLRRRCESNAIPSLRERCETIIQEQQAICVTKS